MFGLFEDPNPMYWKANRKCSCGHKGVSGTRWGDIVSCNGCGALHRIMPAMYPIAKLVDKDDYEVEE